MNRIFCVMAVLVGLAGSAAGQFGSFDLPAAPAGPSDVLTLAAISSQQAVAPGESFTVALRIDIADGWVYYGPQPGGPVKPARLDVSAGPLEVIETRWPPAKPKLTDLGDRKAEILSYARRATVFVTLRAGDALQPGREIAIRITPQGQICGGPDDLCIDVQPLSGESISASAVVRLATTSQPSPDWTPALQQQFDSAQPAEPTPPARADLPGQTDSSRMSLALALGVALLAGLTLNIMPCVLPVIPIRILSIVEMAGASRRRFVTMGLSFAGGMMLFFAAVAGLNIVLKLTTGRAFDLNEGFQNPAVIVALATVVVALAANLLGVFHVIVPGKVASLESTVQSARGGHFKSAGMGVMLAILATPCSFAFLAAALTWAQTASLPAGTAVILTVGLGMSLPHALLAAVPKLVDVLPRPGQWMERFKQTTGFVLLLVAVWLIGTLRGEGSSYPFWVAAWLVLLVLGLWIGAGWVRYDAPLRRKLPVRLIAAGLVVGAGAWMLRPPAPPLARAQSFDWDRIVQARQQGRVVVVKFTAAWCTKCLQQEAAIFNTPAVADVLDQPDVLYVKADVSRRDMPAARWLHENGLGSAVPLTLVYPARGEPLGPFRSDLTRESLLNAIDQARRQGS
jgi:thiol:disulfide interchange protein